MSTKISRGRPTTYEFQDRQRLAIFVSTFGIRATREATGNTVSLDTLIKVAREFGITLKRGRRIEISTDTLMGKLAESGSARRE